MLAHQNIAKGSRAVLFFRSASLFFCGACERGVVSLARGLLPRCHAGERGATTAGVYDDPTTTYRAWNEFVRHTSSV